MIQGILKQLEQKEKMEGTWRQLREPLIAVEKKDAKYDMFKEIFKNKKQHWVLKLGQFTKYPSLHHRVSTVL